MPATRYHHITAIDKYLHINYHMCEPRQYNKRLGGRLLHEREKSGTQTLNIKISHLKCIVVLWQNVKVSVNSLRSVQSCVDIIQCKLSTFLHYLITLCLLTRAVNKVFTKAFSLMKAPIAFMMTT